MSGFFPFIQSIFDVLDGKGGALRAGAAPGVLSPDRVAGGDPVTSWISNLFTSDPGSGPNHPLPMPRLQVTPNIAPGLGPDGRYRIDPTTPGRISAAPQPKYTGMFGLGPQTWEQKLATIGTPLIAGLGGAFGGSRPPSSVSPPSLRAPQMPALPDIASQLAPRAVTPTPIARLPGPIGMQRLLPAELNRMLLMRGGLVNTGQY